MKDVGCEYKIVYTCQGPERADGRGKSCIACHWSCWRKDYKEGDELQYVRKEQ